MINGAPLFALFFPKKAAACGRCQGNCCKLFIPVASLAIGVVLIQQGRHQCSDEWDSEKSVEKTMCVYNTGMVAAGACLLALFVLLMAYDYRRSIAKLSCLNRITELPTHVPGPRPTQRAGPVSQRTGTVPPTAPPLSANNEAMPIAEAFLVGPSVYRVPPSVIAHKG